MVSICMRCNVKDILLQLVDHCHNFVVQVGVILSHHVNKGLDNSGSMAVHADFDKSWCDGSDNLFDVVE